MSDELKHEVTDEHRPDDSWLLKTTHPRILYDGLCEIFLVDLGDGTWCEVFGKNRFERAVQIADYINPTP